MISRNIKRDDRPRIPPSSNDKSRGNGLKSREGVGTGVRREFENEVVRATGISGIFELAENIPENHSFRDRAAGR